MAIPDVRYLGLRSVDLERCKLSDDVKITLNEHDRNGPSKSPPTLFAKKREWQREIQKMLQNDFKLEVESLMSKDISYVTEEYVRRGWRIRIGLTSQIQGQTKEYEKEH